VPTKTTGRDAARKSPVQDYKRGETRFVISLVAMLALPGLAIAAVDRSPWAEFDTIIVGASQTGCEHIGGDAIAAGISIDLVQALGDSRSLSTRRAGPSLFSRRKNELKMSVQLHCLPEEQANLEASIQNVTAGEQLAAFSLDGTIDDLFAFRRKLQTNLYKLLSMGAELHAEQLPDASAYRNYLRAIDGAANDDNRSKIEVLKTAIKTSDKFGPLWTQLGAAQLRLGEADFRNAEDHFAAAETSLGNALDINPTYPLTSDVLAAVYMRTGRTEEAANLVRKAIAARPRSAALRSRLGYAYRYAGLLEESVLEYRRSEALDSRLTNVVSVEGQIAKALIYQGRYEDALRSYDRVRSLLAEYGRSPDEKTLFYEGLTYFYLDQRPKAVQLFDAAYVTEPDTLWSRFAIAYKYAALDNHADLVSIAKRLENDNIADGERRYRLAHFYALAGHHDEAVRHLDTALESGNFNNTYISRDPFLESIRSTKRYSEIIQRMKERHTRFQDSLTEIVRGDSE
jgi:tetratricopeptide (TPR) repeat protein